MLVPPIFETRYSKVTFNDILIVLLLSKIVVVVFCNNVTALDLRLAASNPKTSPSNVKFA